MSIQQSELSMPLTRDVGGLLICLASAVGLWSLIAAFLLVREDYIALALALGPVLALEGIRRLAPLVFGRLAQSVRANIGVFIAISVIALLAMPMVLKSNPYWIHILTLVFIYGFAAQGLNVHLGEIGAINVGYAGFFAIGAYVSAIGIADYGVSFWMSLVYATLACWVVGFLIGACTIKTSGDYLSLVTLGFGLIVYQLAVNLTFLTHGTDGVHIPAISLLGHGFKEALHLGVITLPKEANLYYLALAFLFLAMLLSWRMTNSWIGRTWAAMRQDPVGAGCFGVNVPVMQVLSFAFGGAFAGIAGSLYASEIGFIEPGEFTIFMSISLICMVILGGMGNWWGVVCGAFIMIVVPEKLREFQEMRYLLYGVVLLAILIWRPHGLFAGARRKFEKIIG